MPEENTEILDEICKVCSMGQEAVNLLLPKVHDDQMRTQLFSQRKTYEQTGYKARQMLEENGEEPKNETGPMKKAMLWSGVQMNTLADSSAEHIAEMMVQGTGMGIISLQQCLNDMPKSSSNARTLAENLIRKEEQTIEQLKGML
ncbi:MULTISPECIES: hypothetical protein [Caproicibacterium]|uniref:DUF2383 domain-containing protein n=1 Tax=Caproicibacterium lactatifermentans TaxID=2666138 RepID=A0ABX6PTU3_9FIRM|nr:hypothetical protein [Caproicibacterium lactatifermentans]ARP50559.1 hypothetical protein B6259_06515 [Ruminococcaceae bacterium CPB6]QKO29643.1 hypothetical protein GKP14_00530 [Caproicibacterium lactatifermentans]